MDSLFRILIPLSLAGVAIVLALGLYSLLRGGAFARSNSNRLMRLRVLMQFIAVVILVSAAWWQSSH